ncbi:phospholipase effector Tle1 domain-containing protein [Neisseria canis]|uniref:Uncharacterized conserved protein n=1 Tax=Neisseria canis TaxID=493 RepID=A0A1X3CLD3_9NEIS|nr:DUF2235 domain-containing protein [Neisseria canis]OSI08559.1 hypothetical protein BWD07_12015 [Neisseria canis]VEF00469.1 Uncharacterized conserved protein [Neisseria canis]
MLPIEKPKEKVLGSATTNPPPNTKVQVTLKPLTISVYFDGTGNNYFNTEANRRSGPFKRQPDTLRKSVSYNNYYSNVAMLYLSHKKKPRKHQTVYIEGAGTFRGKEDQSMPGLGAAGGGSGIGMRVDEAVRAVFDIMGENETTLASLNVYGFSRGAAYARYFCHKIRQAEKGSGKRFTINFVGLFDTVSSVGTDHYNDVKEFKLDVGAPEGIRRIVHFTAQNDYRYHFPLTSIKGAVKDGRGFECSFPGAHSDVGGGYYEPHHDVDLLLSNKDINRTSDKHIYYKWYLEKGYFTEAQLKFRHHYVSDFNVNENVTGSRRNVKIDYQFVTAAIMQSLMVKEAGFTKKTDSQLDKRIREMQAVPVLDKFYRLADAYVQANYRQNGLDFSVPLLPPEEMKQLYAGFIHISLDATDKPFNPNAGTPKAKEHSPNGKPNPMRPVRPKVTEGYR